jgi:hypothetical protein
VLGTCLCTIFTKQTKPNQKKANKQTKPKEQTMEQTETLAYQLTNRLTNRYKPISVHLADREPLSTFVKIDIEGMEWKVRWRCCWNQTRLPYFDRADNTLGSLRLATLLLESASPGPLSSRWPHIAFVTSTRTPLATHETHIECRPNALVFSHESITRSPLTHAYSSHIAFIMHARCSLRLSHDLHLCARRMLILPAFTTRTRTRFSSLARCSSLFCSRRFSSRCRTRT